MALDFIAGCLGGFAGILVGHPFDTIKVRLQGLNSASINTSSWKCFIDIIQKESVSGLFKGILSPLYGQVIINSIVFGVHGNILNYTSESTRNPVLLQALAGGVAGACQSLVCSPMELVKIRMQMQGIGSKEIIKDGRFAYKSTLQCFYKIYKYENGFRGIYRGLNATLIREIPSFAVYFSSYYYLCETLNALNDQSVSIPKLLFCGGTAGILSWLVVYPIDVVKTRLQYDRYGCNKYKGVADCLRKGVQEEGLRFCFHGVNATILRAFPVNAATLSVVTVFLNNFKNT